MNEIIVFFLLFLDIDWNNLFSSQDKILEIDNKNYVYCITNDTKENKPCWYLNINENILKERILDTKENTKYLVYDRLYFTNKKNNSNISYLFFKEWKYIFSKEYIEGADFTYYFDSTALYEKNSIIDYLKNIIIGIFTITLFWLILLPKKDFVWQTNSLKK